MPIRVHIACDDKQLRDTIATLLAEDKQIDDVHTSAQAEVGAIALDETRPDVAILAVPPTEDTYRHAMLYRQAADEETVLIGFCTTDAQVEQYQLAGIERLAYLATETAASLREKVRAAQLNGCAEN